MSRVKAAGLEYIKRRRRDHAWEDGEGNLVLLPYDLQEVWEAGAAWQRDQDADLIERLEKYDCNPRELARHIRVSHELQSDQGVPSTTAVSKEKPRE